MTQYEDWIYVLEDEASDFLDLRERLGKAIRSRPEYSANTHRAGPIPKTLKVIWSRDLSFTARNPNTPGILPAPLSVTGRNFPPPSGQFLSD
jgi:hypothetical protein